MPDQHPTPQTGSGETDFAQTMDAALWARAFVERARADATFATDEGNMIGWFANAIMRGFDEATSRATPTASGATVEEARIAIDSLLAGIVVRLPTVVVDRLHSAFDAVIAAAIAQGRAEAEADWRTRASQSIEAAKNVRNETIREVREVAKEALGDEMWCDVCNDGRAERLFAALDAIGGQP